MTSFRIFKHYLPAQFVYLGILEYFVFVFSLYAGTALRFWFLPKSEMAVLHGPLLPRALIFAAILITFMASMGLYQRRFRKDYIGLFSHILVGFVLALFFLTLTYYIFPSIFVGRGILAGALTISLISIIFVRLFFLSVIDQDVLKKRVLVLGSGHKATAITRLRRRVDQRGFNIIGYLPIVGEYTIVKASIIQKNNHSLLQLVKQLDIDEIVTAVDDRRKNLPIQQLLECKMNGHQVVGVETFLERETGKISLELILPSWLIFSDGFVTGRLKNILKRLFDLIFSVALLIMSLPVAILAAFAIYLEDRGPIFFRQRRIGQNAKIFDVLKFRSMRIDAEQDGKARWATIGDQRVTRVGAIMRKLRIDELPQVINVFKGDMSFVGPRPERPEFVDQLIRSSPYYNERHRIKPGITGWAQIRYPYGASEKDAFEKLQYDLYYVKNNNIFFDFTIMLQTAEVILFSKGAR